jgi:nucleoside-triphosphatase THEP1
VEDRVEIFMKNAMIFDNVKKYGWTVLSEILERLGNEGKQKVNRSEIDEEALSIQISKALRTDNKTHKVLVIDEID